MTTLQITLSQEHPAGRIDMTVESEEGTVDVRNVRPCIAGNGNALDLTIVTDLQEGEPALALVRMLKLFHQ